jgi:4-hydroxybenzoate polyprenyltransferase
MIRRIVVFLKTIRAVESTLMCGFPLIGTLFAVDEFSRGLVHSVIRFLVATYGLVIYVYVLNSWGGLETDRKNRRLEDHPVLTGEVTANHLMAVFYIGLAVSFALYLLWVPQCFPIALAIASIWTMYSHPDIMAKARPIFGNLVHFSGGILQFLLGWILLKPIEGAGLLLAVYFAGIFSAGHLNHEVMDHDADREMGLRTNAVVFGPHRMLSVAFGFFTFWSIYLFAITIYGFVPASWTIPFLVVYPIHAIAHFKFRPAPGETYRLEYQKIYRALYVAAGVVVLLTRIFRLCL